MHAYPHKPDGKKLSMLETPLLMDGRKRGAATARVHDPRRWRPRAHRPRRPAGIPVWAAGGARVPPRVALGFGGAPGGGRRRGPPAGGGAPGAQPDCAAAAGPRAAGQADRQPLHHGHRAPRGRRLLGARAPHVRQRRPAAGAGAGPLRGPQRPARLGSHRRFHREEPARHPAAAPARRGGWCCGRQGRAHDLQAIFDRLNGGVLRRARWTRASPGARRPGGGGRGGRSRWAASRSRTGSSASIRCSTTHRCPEYFVAWIVFHEMLHGKHAVVRKGDRRCFHSKEFLAEERTFRRVPARVGLGAREHEPPARRRLMRDPQRVPRPRDAARPASRAAPHAKLD